MTEAWVGFACGAALLFAGAEWLARLLGRAARAAGAGWLVAGPAARAAAGTTAVLAVSLTAGLRGSPGIALGCVIGAAVATIALGLGVAAAGRPLRAILPMLWRQLPAVMAATALVWFFSADGKLSQTNGAALIGAFVLWAVLSVRSVRAATRAEPQPPRGPATRSRILFALLAVAGGAVLVVSHALDLQALLGVSEWRVGVTLVGVAAAAPALVAVVRAGWANDGDAALATAAFANTAGLTLALGVLCVATPFTIRDPAAFRELPALGMTAFLLVPALLNGLRVSRYEGVAWVLAYGALVAWQFGVIGG